MTSGPSLPKIADEGRIGTNIAVSNRSAGSALRTVYANRPSLPRDMRDLLDRMP